MRFVIVAAGTASRLRPLTNDTPKCLLDVGGRPLLGRVLSTIAAAGATEIVIVTGFLEHLIQAAVREWAPELSVTFVSNPEYETTNNACSLLLARPRVAGAEFVLLDSDILFEPGVLQAVLASPHENALALRPADDLGDEEIKCELDEAGRVLAIGKHVPPGRAAGESIGIERFSARASRRLFEVLEERVRGRGLVREYYEASFQQLIEEGVAIHAVSVGGLYCAEIDTLDDLSAARLRAETL